MRLGWPDPEGAVAFVGGAADEFAHALAGRDGSTRPPTTAGRSPATSRTWGTTCGSGPNGSPRRSRGEERTVEACDPDALGRARGYDAISPAGALWSLRHSASAWVEVLRAGLDTGAVLRQATRGDQRAADVAGNNAHDAFHHLHDVRRALGLPGRPAPLRLTGNGVALRRSTSDDAARITAWLADPAVHRWWGSHPVAHEEVLEKYCGAREPDVAVFVVERADRPVGVLQAWQESGRPGVGGLDLFLAADEQGRGTGPVAARLLAGDLVRRGWTSVTADPAEGNPRAVAAWRRAGFTPTGVSGEDDGRRTVLLEFRPR